MATQSVGSKGSAEIGSARDDLQRPLDTVGWAGREYGPCFMNARSVRNLSSLILVGRIKARRRHREEPLAGH